MPQIVNFQSEQIEVIRPLALRSTQCVLLEQAMISSKLIEESSKLRHHSVRRVPPSNKSDEDNLKSACGKTVYLH